VEILSSQLEQRLERIGRWQPRINAFIRVAPERAREQARRARGPLAGMPLAHKDMFYRAGEISTAGSAARRSWRAPRTAAALERLDAAGALDLGTLNMSEFAYGITGHNAAFGDCRNPWNRDYIPGGSSSGSAAAVAAGLCDGALGSDTGGSIRIPSAVCGVTGLKTTLGAVDRAGTLPLAHSLDTLGPIARSAKECALLFEVLTGTAPWRGRVRVGVARRWIEDHCHAEVATAVLEAADVLAALEVAMPEVETLSAHCMLVMQVEAAAVHARALREARADYEPVTRARLEPGLATPAPAYHHALRMRGAALGRFCAATLKDADALLMPVMRIRTPTLAETGRGGGAAGAQVLAELSRLLHWVNYLGVPSLALPCGFDSRGLPIGLQLVARPHAEPLLLAAGAAYQEKTGWHQRVPTLEKIHGTA
jgi:aspartyl-tRNA(Asn)/glutamyl-tRNA(Gln) amidotransferase subunit A